MKPGDKYGRWTVIGPAPMTARERVRCRCDCGTERKVVADNLRRGVSQSCGCLRAEIARSARRPPAERFWVHVNKGGPVPQHRPELGCCWVWTNSTDDKGYGCFNDGQRSRKAHEVSYELVVGPVPPGLELDHLCRNQPCVRPTHLEAVTHRENCQRAAYSSEECSKGHALPEPGPNGRRVCRECANDRNRTYKQRQREQATPQEPKPIIHGRGRYTHHGCRCGICCDAENAYKRQWRRGRSAHDTMRVYDAVMGGAT